MGHIDIQKAFGHVTSKEGTSLFELVKSLPNLNPENNRVHASFALRPDQEDKIVTLMINDCEISNLEYREDIPLPDRKKGLEGLYGPQDRRVRATLTVSKNEDSSVSISVSHYRVESEELECEPVGSVHLKDRNFEWGERGFVESCPDLITSENHIGLSILSDVLVRYAHDHPTLKSYIEPSIEDQRCLDNCRIRQLALWADKYKFANG